MLEQPEPVGPVGQLPVFLFRQPGSEEVECPSGLIDRDNGAVAGSSQRTGALHDLLQDRFQIQARTDAQDRRTQFGYARSQCGYFRIWLGCVLNRHQYIPHVPDIM